MSGPRQPWLAAFVLYAAAWAVLSSPWLSGTVTIPWDAKAHFYPQLQFLAQSLHRGEWPFWAPFVFSGSPQVADPQALIVQPPFLLLAALDPNPGFRAFDGVVLGMLGLGGIFVILIFRDRDWHWMGALVAAIVFAFGASASWRIQHVGQILSLAALPITYWLLARTLARQSFLYGVLTGIAAGFLALGRDQVAYLSLLLLAAAVLAHLIEAPSRLTRLLGPLAVGAVAAIVILAVPVGLTLLLAQDSNRPAIVYSEAARGAVHPALLLTSLIPNLFGADGPFGDYWGPPSPRWGPTDLVLARNMGVLYLGALPFALLVAGLLNRVLFVREIRPVTIGFVVMLLYALGAATPVYRAAFELLPGVDFFRRPADSTFLVGALGAILAGYLVHRIASGSFLRDGPPFGFAAVVMVLAVYAAAVALALAKGTLAIAAWPLMKSSLCLAVALALLSVLAPLMVRHPRWAAGLLLLTLVGDLAWNNGPSESTGLPPGTYDVLRPESRNETVLALRQALGENGLDRIELTGLGFHWPNASLVHRMHNVLGYNPVRLKLYSEATGAGDHVALPEQRSFSPLFPSYRSMLADLLGLRLIATGVPIERIDPALKPGDLGLVARTPDGFVYENARALPRALFVEKALPVDLATLLKDGRWPAFDPLTTVLLAEPPPGNATATADDGAPARVRIVRYGNTEVLFEVETARAGYLVLNDPYHPWWVAEVDGRDSPILQANAIFRAVHLEPGAHHIRFVFRPFSGAWQEARRRWAPLRWVSEATGFPS